MCLRETAIVTLAHALKISGRTEIEVDACIAPLVQALNDAGVHTVGCCCGHFKQPGSILILQGEEQLALLLPRQQERPLLADQPEEAHDGE
jgi:hypothetical protein